MSYVAALTPSSRPLRTSVLKLGKRDFGLLLVNSTEAGLESLVRVGPLRLIGSYQKLNQIYSHVTPNFKSFNINLYYNTNLNNYIYLLETYLASLS